jgi:hypothetical protein
MMAKDKRFELATSQGITPNTYQVIVDNETGVNYFYVRGGGLTVLVDADGKPIVTKDN